MDLFDDLIDDNATPAEQHPGLQQSLKSAQDKALETKDTSIMTPERIEEANKLSELFAPSGPSLALAFQSAQGRNITKEELGKASVTRVPQSGDEPEHYVRSGPVLDRDDIYKQQLNDVLQRKYPETYANIMQGLERDRNGIPLEKYDATLANQATRIVKDMTGEDVKIVKMSPNDKNYNRDFGYYHPKSGEVRLKDLSDINTAVHEALHQKYKGEPHYEEELKNLASTKDLVQGIRDVNARHIPYNIKEKGISELSGPEGEAGLYYDVGKQTRNNQYAGGGPVDFDSLQEDQAPSQGAQTPSFDDLVDDSEKYETPGQMAITAAEAAGRGLVGPLAPAIERGFGVKKEDILARQKANPIISGAGEAAGLGVGLLAGTGEAALMTKAGELAAEASGLSKLSSFGARIGSSAVQQATEMAVLQGSDEVSKMVLQDPETSAETAVANIGMAAALGGAGGAFMTGAVSPLWKATVGNKAEAFLSTLASKLGGVEGAGSSAVDLAGKAGVTIPAELAAKINGSPFSEEAFSKLSQTDTTIAGRKLQETLANFNDDLGNKLLETVGHDSKYVEGLSELNKYDTGHIIGDSLEKELTPEIKEINARYDKKTSEYKNIPVTTDNLRTTADKLAQKSIDEGWTKAESEAQTSLLNRVLKKLPQQETAEDMKKFISNLRESNPFGSDTYYAAKDISKILSESQSHAIEQGILAKGGDAAAELQDYQNLRGSYANLMNKLDNINEHLHVGKYDGPQTFLNALKELKTTNAEGLLNRMSGASKSQILDLIAQYPETLAKIRQFHVDNVLRKSVDNLGKFNTTRFSNNFDKLSPQIKNLIADEARQSRIKGISEIVDKLKDEKHNWSNTGRTVDKLTQRYFTPLTLLSSFLGHPGSGILAHLGSIGFTEGKDALKLGMMRFLGSNQPIKSEGFKSAVTFFNEVYKGETMMNKAVSGVLSAGSKVLSANEMPAKEDLMKLDKLVAKNQENPSNVAENQNSDLGHYLPNHQMSLTQVSTRALQYLQSIKPQAHAPSPLGRKIEPSQLEIARYNRALEIAQQPTIIFQKVKDGTLKTTDMQDLNAMYPGLYKNMAQKLSNEISNNREANIPYKTRVGLSLFLGQPLDGSMQPASMQSIQSVFAPKPAPQPQGAPRKKGTSALGKTNKEFRTPNQAAEAQDSERK